MYVTVDGFQALMNWFESERNRYSFLCLFVARDLESRRLFSDLLQDWYSINAATQEGVAVFLFSDEETGTLAWPLGEGMYRVIPGLVLPRGNSYRGLDVLTQQMVRTLTPADHAALISKSQSMSHDICEYFRLDRNVLPCILLVGKGELEPLVVSTRDVARMPDVLDLLNRFRSLAELLSEATESTPVVDAKALAIESGIRSTQEQIEKLAAEVGQLSKQAVLVLVEHGAPRSASELALSPVNAAHAFDALGMNVEKRPLDTSIRDVAQSALQDSDFHALLRKLQREGRRLKATERELSRLQGEAISLFPTQSACRVEWRTWRRSRMKRSRLPTPLTAGLRDARTGPSRGGRWLARRILLSAYTTSWRL